MTKIRRQVNKEKAIDKALWLNFKHRVAQKTFGVNQSIEGDFLITDTNHPALKDEVFELLPENYVKMGYSHIKHIAMDENPLRHWEEIRGIFSVLDGEILRYILHAKIPLEKLIRYELASRGFNENHLWCGFEKASDIWLK